MTLSLYGALLLTVLYVVKFNGWRMPALPGLEDYGWIVFLEMALAYLPLHGWASAMLSTIATLVFVALWLDAVLFRVFTIELGPSGVGTAVTSALYRELTGMRSARRFFKENLAFTALPLAALLLHFERWLPPATTRVASTLLLAYAAWALVSLRWGGSGRSAVLASRLVRPFFWTPRRRAVTNFSLRPEDAHFGQLGPKLPPPSRSYGLLSGESVLIWTVESMGRDYLAAFSPGFARTPFIDQLLETGVRCDQHFALSPLTHNAHVLLYASRYAEEDDFAPMKALRHAGYRTIYLTSCDTKAYGLRGLLMRAGFEHILDQPASDADFLSSAWAKLAPLLTGDAPWFLHVQTANTHVPYRLSNPKEFCRFDSHDDLGRFLNGLEEADFHLAQFVSRVAALPLARSPLLVVSGDHGQSFGQFGYHSHGSAVVKEQVMVPCMFSHQKLNGQRVPYSSHLDVLPTVLDLLGVPMGASFGASVLGPRPKAAYLLWAGHPSRTRTSHFGLVNEQRKYMLDWTVDKGYELDWNDQFPRELLGAEKDYYRTLISHVATRVGVE